MGNPAITWFLCIIGTEILIKCLFILDRFIDIIQQISLKTYNIRYLRQSVPVHFIQYQKFRTSNNRCSSKLS